MTTLTADLRSIFRLISSITVRGDDVDALAVARAKLRELITASEEVTENDT